LWEERRDQRPFVYQLAYNGNSARTMIRKGGGEEEGNKKEKTRED
jgi:hypothetical protein